MAPSGKVVAGDHFNITAAMIEEQLKDAVTYPQADYSKKFDACLKAIRANDLLKAGIELAKLSKEAGKDGENAKALEKWIDDLGAKKLAQADAAAEKGEVFEARDLLVEVEKKFPPKYDCVKAAKDKWKTFQADKDVKKVLAQEKNYLAALDADRAKDAEKAAALFMKCAKGAPGTKFAEKCEEKARSLGGAR